MLAVWVCRGIGENTWSEPTKVVGPPIDPPANSGRLFTVGVGEATLTTSGTLYVVVLFFDAATEAFDLDIVRIPVRR